MATDKIIVRAFCGERFTLIAAYLGNLHRYRGFFVSLTFLTNGISFRRSGDPRQAWQCLHLLSTEPAHVLTLPAQNLFRSRYAPLRSFGVDFVRRETRINR